MKLQEILNINKVQKELDEKMRANWLGIPEDFKPNLDLNKPHSLQDLNKVSLEGVNNYSKEVITLKELNFLYLYCFVKDFHLFYKYEKANQQDRRFYSLPNDLKVFRRFSYSADIKELEQYVVAYDLELENYTNTTGRDILYSILD